MAWSRVDSGLVCPLGSQQILYVPTHPFPSTRGFLRWPTNSLVLIFAPLAWVLVAVLASAERANATRCRLRGGTAAAFARNAYPNDKEASPRPLSLRDR